MKVWLTRKHADRLDGVDLRAHRVGDTLDLQPGEAWLLLAEEWAALERRLRPRSSREGRGRRASDDVRG